MPGKIKLALLIILAIVAVPVLAFFYARLSLPFYPDRHITNTPAALGLPYEEVFLHTTDDKRIAGWFIPAAAGNDSGLTLLFFHGNAGNLSSLLPSLGIFHDLGLAVFAIDYRGFGKSDGSPSVHGTALDARAAWDWLRAQKKLKPEQIVIHGRSLGGGVAAALAAETRPAGLILESTFTSLHEVADDLFPLVPADLFLPQDFDTLARLRGLSLPLLVIHSPDDELVGYHMGRKLYESYAGPKQFLELRGSHNEGFMKSLEIYKAGLRLYLQQLRGGKPPIRAFHE